jgi:hypothetical protein
MSTDESDIRFAFGLAKLAKPIVGTE